MKKVNLIIVFLVLSIISCKKYEKKQDVPQPETKTDIVSIIIEDKNSFYHIDFSNYPNGNKNLPIGVFDSGTGGLTVLKAIVNYDENNNESYA